MSRRWGGVLVVALASCALAETWADEEPTAPRALTMPPAVGLTAGMQLGSGLLSNVGPLAGAHLGIRLRLARHAALSVMALYEFQNFSAPSFTALPRPDVITTEHLISGVVRLEIFSVSAFEKLLVPELSIGFFLGSGASFMGLLTKATFTGGLHLGMTRLRPSGWWFPVFVEVGLQWFESETVGRPYLPFWRFSVGVGL